MTLFRQCAALAAMLAAIGIAPTAHAGNAYWHGVRSDDWNGGIVAGQSNWYSKPPPNGTAQPVPTGEAFFAPRARRFAIRVTDDTIINDITFIPTSPKYRFTVLKTFEVAGGGVDNQSTRTIPFFDIKGTMSFTHEANAGNVDYQTEALGTLDFASGQGPLKGFELIVGSIVNFGSVNTGPNTLQIERSFLQQPNGVLQIDVTKAHTGRIIADLASLNGTLVVEGRPDVVAGTKLLVRGKTLAGKFKRVLFYRFPDNLKAEVKYVGNDVNLVLSRP